MDPDYRYDLNREVLHFTVKGDICSTTADSVRAQAAEMLARCDALPWRELVVNMKSATQLDSVGLNMLHGLIEHVRQKDREVRLMVAEPTIKKVLEFALIQEMAAIDYQQRRRR